jgi:methionine synthase / methylenetetrahydrofolate reductase(NADPH)
LAKKLTCLPVIAQMAFGLRGDTLYGISAAEVWRQCRDAGADAVGANCGMGAPAVLQAISKMPAGLPLTAFFNAGFPEQVEGRMLYHAENDYLATRALEAVNKGVKLIGGCCGTTPDIIRAIASKVSGRTTSPAVVIIETPQKIVIKETAKLPQLSAKYPLYVEIDSPSDAENNMVFEAAAAIKEAGATLLTVADNPLSTSRADSMFFSYLLQQKVGIPVVPHLTGRDRNRIALRSGLLAASLAGITSVLCVTGDPIRMCEEPNTTGVFDLTSVGLVRLAVSISSDNPLSVGVAVNPNVRTIQGQIDKLLRKIEAGTTFALSQPIFEIDRWHIFSAACADAGITIPIYPGIMPLTSTRNAEFLHNEVPGINIPAEIREKLSQYPAVPDQRKASVDICIDMAAKLKAASQGLYMICPRSIHALVTPVLESITN